MRLFFIAAKLLTPLKQLNNFVYLQHPARKKHTHSTNMGRNFKFVHSLRGCVQAHMLVNTSRRLKKCAAAPNNRPYSNKDGM